MNQWIIIFFVTLNVLACFMMGYDKWMARSRAWRVSEATLWIVALLGGSIGILIGAHTFRHKTVKLSFQLVLAAILALQLALVGIVFQYR